MAASKNEDWRSDCKDIAAMQNKAKDGARFTDVQFVMGKGSYRRTFNAHKAILACASPVFEKMFYGALPEKKSTIETDDDPEAFEMLLNYIYGKCTTLKSLTTAWKYYTIGDKYLVSKIPECSKQYVDSTSLNERSFWEIIESKIFSSPLFDNTMKSYIRKNAKELLVSEKFLSTPEAVVNTILQLDKLNVQENELLLGVTKWGCKNLAPVNWMSLRNLYKHIRFSTLSMDQFFDFIEIYKNAIDAESSLAILQHLHCASRHTLPKWCCTSDVSRFKEFQRECLPKNRRYDAYGRLIW